MADWTDGPEYAPASRPAVFVEPDAAPPLAAPPGPDRVDGHPGPDVDSPAPRPDYAPLDAPALADADPEQAPSRDPRSAFDVGVSLLGGRRDADDFDPRRPLRPGFDPDEDGHVLPLPSAAVEPRTPGPMAWQSAHAQGRPVAPPPPRPPDADGPRYDWPPPAGRPWEPPQQAPYPGDARQPGAGDPAPWDPRRPGFRSVTLAQMLTATTPAVLITMALGFLVAPIAFPLLLVAWALAGRIRYRRAAVARFFSWSLTISLLLALLGPLSVGAPLETLDWLRAAGASARWAHLAGLIALPLIVGEALRRDEPPER